LLSFSSFYFFPFYFFLFIIFGIIYNKKVYLKLCIQKCILNSKVHPNDFVHVACHDPKSN
ncbi:hypothetical protein C1646_814614, partial [Rhizophagus diaphanus]